MSQNYSFDLDRMLDNNPASPESGEQSPAGNSPEYATQGNTRNLCFAWPDGRRFFLNYSYMVSAEYQPAASLIMLVFTTHEITLKGIRLELLFEQLMAQLPRIVSCRDVRYNTLVEANEYAVNGIAVEKL